MVCTDSDKAIFFPIADVLTPQYLFIFENGHRISGVDAVLSKIPFSLRRIPFITHGTNPLYVQMAYSQLEYKVLLDLRIGFYKMN